MMMEPLLERLQENAVMTMGPTAVRRPRRASALRGFVADPDALEALVRAGDPVIYETFEPPVPETPGHLMFGITVLYPGKIGAEYFMTKGHFHVQRQTAEVYVCLRGRGYLVLETEQRDTRALSMEQGSIVYVAPGWAHRSVNAGAEPFILFYTFPADAGHDYDVIARRGFALRVLDVHGSPTVVGPAGRGAG